LVPEMARPPRRVAPHTKDLIETAHSGLQVSFFIEKFLYEWRHHSLNGVGRRAFFADKDPHAFIIIATSIIATSDQVTASATHGFDGFIAPMLYLISKAAAPDSDSGICDGL
jgi:hypothetical protein